MDPVETLSAGLKLAAALFDSPELEPDPARKDWAAQRGKLDELAAAVNEQVLAPLEAVLPQIDPSDHDRVRQLVARYAASTAGALAAAGRRADAADLLSKATAVASDASLQSELNAGRRSPGDYALLTHGRWLHRNGQAGKAVKVLTPLERGSSEPALQKAAAELLAEPRPITSAPPLFTFNSIGVSLFGGRDRHDDGSHVSTLCLTALFLPIFPLAAYRVIPQEENRYLFLGRVPLWAPWRWMQRLTALAAVLWVAAFGVTSYLRSPDRLASLAVDEAAALERAGKSAEAIAAYESAIEAHRYVSSSKLAPAVQGWVRLSVAAVKEPFTPESVGEAERLWLGLKQMPDWREASGTLLAKLRAWAGGLDPKAPRDRQAKMRLLELAADLAGKEELAEVNAQLLSLRLEAARDLAGEWPLDAFEQYVKIGADPAALAAAGELLRGLGEAPSLYLESATEIASWLSMASAHEDLVLLAQEVKSRATSARELVSAKGRDELLASGDEARLAADFAKFPLDQDTAVALARVQRDRGALAKATATLESLGTPGKMAGDGQLLLAICYADAGQSARAEHLAEHYLDRWLARFQAARKALDAGGEALQQRVIADARAGRAPSDVEAKFRAANGDEDKEREVFSAWLSDTFAKDPALMELRAAYQRHLGVVPAALMLGTLRLARANAASGAERKELLADTERIFLSVRQEAEGKPAYHLGLGQVFHRLGKIEEGERELTGLLAAEDYSVHLQVSEVYRELGLMPRAREICEAVFAKAPQPARDHAASKLAILATVLKDKESWLSKVATTSPAHEAHLAELRGHLRLSEGKCPESEREFAAAAAFYAKSAAISAPAGNNAALAYVQRLGCSGDVAHLDKAIGYFETAVRLSPDNTLILSNAAGTLAARAAMTVVSKWVHPRPLRLNGKDAMALLSALAEGPLRAEVTAALRENPHYRRSLELSRRQEILAPKWEEPYASQLTWYGLFEDREALEALGERLHRVGAVNSGESSAARERWRKGEDDAEHRARISARIALREAALADPHGPTRAAALMLTSVELDSLADVDPGLKAAHLQRALETARASARAWDGLGAESLVTKWLLRSAIPKVAREQPKLEAAWKRDERVYDVSTIVYREGAADPAVFLAFRRQPELTEALALVQATPKERLRLTDWLIAVIAGDGALRERAAESLRASTDPLQYELLSRLDSGESNVAGRLELMRAVTGATAKAP